MLRRLRILLALGFLIASPALADVITDVTVSGSVSGTGNLTVVCYFSGSPPPGCYQVVPGRYIQNVSTSFSATNTQLGDFSDSSQVSGGFPPIYLVISASQSTTATADSLSSDLFTVFSIPPAGAGGYDVRIQNSIVIGFDLTTESLLQVSGYFGSDSQLLDSNGNPIVGCCSSSLVLEPGMYEFTQSLPLTAAGSFLTCGGGCGHVSGSVLDAKFTPIPEPRWAGFTLLIALACWRPRITHKRQG